MVETYAEARLARVLFRERFIESRLGTMAFWESLHESEKLLAAHVVNQIIGATFRAPLTPRPTPAPKEAPNAL